MPCYPAFQNVRSMMEKLHILSTPNKEHKKVFPNDAAAEFWNGKSLNWLESNHPNLRRVEDVTHVQKIIAWSAIP